MPREDYVVAGKTYSVPVMTWRCGCCGNELPISDVPKVEDSEGSRGPVHFSVTPVCSKHPISTTMHTEPL